MSLDELRAKMRDQELEIARQFGLDPQTAVSGSLEFHGPDRLTYTRWDPASRCAVRGVVAKRVHPPVYVVTPPDRPMTPTLGQRKSGPSPG